MLIYTDEDIRLDLLNPAESRMFPQELTAEDRRHILMVTRERADRIDWNGHPILSPDRWLEEYRKQAVSAVGYFNPQLVPVIRNEVVIPSSGEVVLVDAGLADVIQKLMDRGVAVDCEKCVSGMVTDHPGARQLYPVDESDLFLSALKPGEHLYGHTMPVSTVLEFPLDNRRQAFNDPRIAEALTKAALQSGLVVSKSDADALRIMLPCCMDGTGEQQVRREAGDLRKDIHEVVQAHGGMALYTDAMIQDRLSRFGRAVERMFIADRTLGQKQEETGINYSNFLLSDQINSLHEQEERKIAQLWLERVPPYFYRPFKESPAKVDKVARMAGFKDYREYVQSQMNHWPDGKRRNTFKKLEQQMLHTDSRGLLMLYRIKVGMAREVDSWLLKQQSLLAQPAMKHHRLCGYPLDKIKDISIVTGKDGKAMLYADLGNRMISKPARKDSWDRLMSGACTPFELALDTIGHEIGWNGKLNFPVSSDTVRSLDLQMKDGGGRMPLTHDGKVYRVNADVWQHAWLLTRFRQLPDSLQQQLLDVHPSRRDVMQLNADELKQRFSSMDRNLRSRINNMHLSGLDKGKLTLACTVDGAKRSIVTTMDELEFRDRLLPDMDIDMLRRQLLADKLQLTVIEETRARTFKR